MPPYLNEQGFDDDEIGLFGRPVDGASAPSHGVPLVGVSFEAHVVDFIAECKLTQCYHNTELYPVVAKYHFPVDEAAAVCGFEAVYEDGRIVKGVVKEKEQARQEYNQAVSRGKQANLLEAVRRDILSLKVGNLPAGSHVKITITYVTSLKARGDAAALIVPTYIAPRYSPPDVRLSDEEAQAVAPNNASVWILTGISIRIHFRCLSNITAISCPTHEAQYVCELQGNTGQVLLENVVMDRDVVALVTEEQCHQPRAIIEKSGSSLAGFVTLFPKLEFADAKREFVFVVDRSGSMAGSQIRQARDTLLLFLRALPVNCTFNIVGFGGTYRSLFKVPVAYNDETLETATRYAQNMTANMGGTEIKRPLEYVFGQPSALSNVNRRVFVLTDGQVSNDKQVFEVIRRHCATNHATSRLYSVGVGSGVSRHLVEGMARAGLGTARFVGDGAADALREKVLGQLKQALEPSLHNVSIKWNMPTKEQEAVPPAPPPVKTLLGYRSPSVDIVAPPNQGAQPKIFPNNIPPVFNCERFLSFALFPVESGVPKSVTVSCLTPDGALETTLDIAAGDVFQGNTAHRMAARAAIIEFEDTGKSMGQRTFAPAATTAINKTEALQLALANRLVSEQTSFVTVLEDSVEPAWRDPVACVPAGSRFAAAAAVAGKGIDKPEEPGSDWVVLPPTTDVYIPPTGRASARFQRCAAMNGSFDMAKSLFGVCPESDDEEDEVNIGRKFAADPDDDEDEDGGRRFGGRGLLPNPPAPAAHGVFLRHVERVINHKGEHEYAERNIQEFKYKTEDEGQVLDHYVPDCGVYDPGPVVAMPKYQERGGGGAQVSSDDVGLGVFMEHLAKLAVESDGPTVSDGSHGNGQSSCTERIQVLALERPPEKENKKKKNRVKAPVKLQAVARGFIVRQEFQAELKEKREKEHLNQEVKYLEDKVRAIEMRHMKEVEEAREGAEKEIEAYKAMVAEEKKADKEKSKKASTQPNLLDESGKIIEFLRKENMKLRKQNDCMRKDFKSLKENNARLLEANASEKKADKEKSKKAAPHAAQGTLIDESGKIIEYLRKENMKLRNQNGSMCKDFKSLKENNARLMEANASASASFTSLNDHAKQLNAANVKLVKNAEAYKAQLEKLKEDLKTRQSYYLAEAEARLAYQKMMAQIVGTIQDKCCDAQLTEDVVSMALECEAEAKSERAALDDAGKKAAAPAPAAAKKKAPPPPDSSKDCEALKEANARLTEACCAAGSQAGNCEKLPTQDKLLSLCLLQKANGSFVLHSSLAQALDLSESATHKIVEALMLEADVLNPGSVKATLLAIAAMRVFFATQKSVWELQEDKALQYIVSCGVDRSSLDPVLRSLDSALRN